MPANLDDKLVVALSSRALFDFEEENSVFEAADPRTYQQLQFSRIDKPAAQGIAFTLVKKLLAFNASPHEQRVEVVILSRNDPVTGLRVFRSAEHHKLPITRGVFLRGRSPYGYLEALKADLFLSAIYEDVRLALQAGFPAARVYKKPELEDPHPAEVRIAFDGDAVLFSDEAERIYQERGLPAFEEHERTRAGEPLPPGPLQPFLRALHVLQKGSTPSSPMRIRTALVTARSAPAHDRAIRTLMSWDIEVDEAMFLGGLEKGPFLRVFEPDFYFDDQLTHVQSAALAGPSGHVSGGVVNLLRSTR